MRVDYLEQIRAGGQRREATFHLNDMDKVAGYLLTTAELDAVILEMKNVERLEAAQGRLLAGLGTLARWEPPLTITGRENGAAAAMRDVARETLQAAGHSWEPLAPALTEEERSDG